MRCQKLEAGVLHSKSPRQQHPLLSNTFCSARWGVARQGFYCIVFRNVFTEVREIHDYETRQSANNSLYPPTGGKTELSFCKYTYRGPLIWNMVLKAKINPDVSEFAFGRMIKQCIKVKII